MSSPTESTFKHIPVLRRRSLSSVSDLDSPTRLAPPSTPRKSRRMSLSDPLRRHVPSSVVSLLAALAVIMLSNQLFGLNLLPTGSKSPVAFLRGNSASDGLASSYDRLASEHAALKLSHQDTLTRNAKLARALSDFSGKPVADSAALVADALAAEPALGGGAKPDPRYRFTMEDFITHLAVEPMHFMEVDPVIAPIIAQHDITQDEAFKNEEWEMERRQRMFGPWIERGTKLDKRFYVAFTDDTRGFGLFAGSPVRKGDVLGVYSGVLTNNSFTTDYVWTYLSETIKDPETGAVLDLGIDAKHRGNWFRFANDGPPHELNAEVYYVPYNNLWHVVYVASKAIQPDEEILVSYGASYWASRPMLDANGKPVNKVPVEEEESDEAADEEDVVRDETDKAEESPSSSSPSSSTSA